MDLKVGMHGFGLKLSGVHALHWYKNASETIAFLRKSYISLYSIFFQVNNVRAFGRNVIDSIAFVSQCKMDWNAGSNFSSLKFPEMFGLRWMKKLERINLVYSSPESTYQDGYESCFEWDSDW